MKNYPFGIPGSNQPLGPGKQGVLDDVFNMINTLENLTSAEMADVLALYMGQITYLGLLHRYGKAKADFIVKYMAMSTCAMFAIYSLSKDAQSDPLTDPGKIA